MSRKDLFITLIDMLREIDLEKNSKEILRDVLDYIVDNLETYIEDIEESEVNKNEKWGIIKRFTYLF